MHWMFYGNKEGNAQQRRMYAHKAGEAVMMLQRREVHGRVAPSVLSRWDRGSR